MFKYLYPISAILQSMDVGSGIGWSMPASEYLMNEHPRRVFGGEESDVVPGFSQTIMSWVFSIQTLILTGMCLFFGPYMHHFSSRTILIFFGFFKIVFYGIIIFLDTTPSFIILARCFFGASLILFGSVPLYLEEITEVNNRGSYISFCDVALNLGVLFAYILGMSVNFHYNIWILFLISIAIWCACLFVPESPIYLQEKGDGEKTLKVLKRIRAKNHDFNTEINNIDEYLKTRDQKNPTISHLLALIRHKRHYRNSILMVIMLFMFQHLSGIVIIQHYTMELINQNTSLNEYIVVVITGLTACLGSLLASCFTDRYGRRPLLLTSVGAVTVCFGFFALYIFKIFTFRYIPIISFSCHVFMVNIGLGPLPNVIMTELLPYQIRYCGSYLGILVFALTNFMVNNTFYSLQEALGVAWVFFLYSMINLIGFILIWFYIPETKGIPRHLIEQTIFLNNNIQDIEMKITENKKLLAEK